MTSSELGLIRERAGASAVLSLQHDDCLAYWGIDYGELCTCTAGLGRAPLAVLAYRTWIEGTVAEETIQDIHWGRPGAVPAWEAPRGCWGDLVAAHRQRIAERAYALSWLRPPDQSDAQAECLRAEREVIRAVLLAEKRLPDPSKT